MNSLVKELIKPFLLEENTSSKVIGFYGGGFKPPTKGHFNVVVQALAEYPELDELIILVGEKERDNITQAQSLLVWEIYQNFLPSKVKVEPVSSPIGDIKRFAKNHPDDTIYFILGARENNEDDLKDISLRTNDVKVKYPNMEVKVIKSSNTISGTKARNAILSSNRKEFFNYIPNILSDVEKEEIYKILSPKPLDVDEGTCGYNTDVKTGEIFNTPGGLEEESKVNEYQNQTTLNPSVFDDIEIKPKVKEILLRIAKFFWKEMDLPIPYEDIILIGSSANYNWTPYSDIDLHIVVDLGKYMDPELAQKYFNEVKNNWNKTHKLKINDNHIELYIQDINEPNAAQGVYSLLNNKWIKIPKYEKIDIPDIDINRKAEPFKFEINKLISNPDLNKINLLKKRLKNFRKAGLTNEGEYSLENLAYKELRNSGYLDKLRELEINTIDSQLLKENATYSSFIDYKQQIKDLTKYMIEKGLNITPLPKVIFKHNNINNAKDFLGKTAYYDPIDKAIIIYTEGRHPKDIVRSFSHEMIHHMQNIEDRLGNITTTNTQEDDHLNDLEAEANLKGTMTFRNWTDVIKKNNISESKSKDPFGLNAYALELARGLEEELVKNPSQYIIYCDMDGVLCDFDSQFEKYYNIHPQSISNKELVEAVDAKGIEFWSEMKWVKGGEKIWSMISPYNPSLLTSPGKFKYAEEGKKIWVANNLNPQPNDIIFAQARNKHLVLSGKSSEEIANSILIDDYYPNVAPWKSAGGIVAYNTPTGKAIRVLYALGFK